MKKLHAHIHAHTYTRAHALKRVGFAAALALAAFACSCVGNDDDDVIDPAAPSPTPAEVTPTMTMPVVGFGMGFKGTGRIEWLPETGSRGMDSRAGTPKPPIAAQKPDIMGVYGYNNLAATGQNASLVGEIFANTPVYNREGPDFESYNIDLTPFPDEYKWPYENPVKWRPGGKYLFFAYAPYASEGDAETVEARTATYDGFDRFLWEGMPKICNRDHMIASKIYTYDSHTDGTLNEVQDIYFTHLQARLRFCFKLGPRYGELRVIRLKRMQLEDLHGRTLLCTIDFNRQLLSAAVSGDRDGYDMQSLKWIYSGSVEEQEYVKELYNERDADNNPLPYIELSAANESLGYQPLASAYVYPDDDVNALKIRVWYDVFDLDGQLLRQDDEAVNSLPISFYASTSTATERRLRAGYYYDVNITVEPTFLYVLSDADPGLDGFIVVKP